MYIPPHFSISERDEIIRFIRQNAFGQLISHVEGRLFASHLPFLLPDDGGKLLAHLAKPNPQWKQIEGQEVLITFQGPHDYISPSWYKAPGVPTWNYQAVHVYGKCQLLTEAADLRQIVDALTGVYEAGASEPWVPQYDEKMLRGIVGLSIDVVEIQCKYKLNQNRSVEDREQVCAHLEQSGSHDLAATMSKYGAK
ncbi:MAG: FMN-binding negative transcriptional regulator [Pseudohongiella sp.]|nr:FMN-binding negative transcriptional regulator [Pseudohongiella sp.]